MTDNYRHQRFLMVRHFMERPRLVTFFKESGGESWNGTNEMRERMAKELLALSTVTELSIVKVEKVLL